MLLLFLLLRVFIDRIRASASLLSIYAKLGDERTRSSGRRR